MSHRQYWEHERNKVHDQLQDVMAFDPCNTALRTVLNDRLALANSMLELYNSLKSKPLQKELCL